MDAGGTGETDRMGAWSEILTKSCSAGTDSAPERTSTAKEVREAITDVAEERALERTGEQQVMVMCTSQAGLMSRT